MNRKKITELTEKEMVNVLKVEGVNCYGFGTIAQAVMRDINLSRDSRWLYAYISSFAGSGTTAFPSRDTILKEGKMSKNKYYDCLNELEKRDLVRVQPMKEKGRFQRNLFTLVTKPRPRKKDTEKDTVKKLTTSSHEGHGPCPLREDTKSINVLKEFSNTNVLENLRYRMKLDEVKPKKQIDIEYPIITEIYLEAKGKFAITLNNTDELTVTEQRRFRSLLKHYNFELIHEAIIRMIEKCDKYPMAYIEKTLADWKKKSITTYTELTAYEKVFYEQRELERIDELLGRDKTAPIDPSFYYDWMNEE